MTTKVFSFSPSLHLRTLLYQQDEGDSDTFHAFVISVAQSALVIIFKGAVIEGSDRDGSFAFPKTLSVQTTSITVSKKLIPHFFIPTNASFSGSYLFAALHVMYSPIADSTFSHIKAAFGKQNVPFYQSQNRYVRLEDKWTNFSHLEGLKFYISYPFYKEIRIHQRESKLLELQTVEIEACQRQIQLDKQKEVQLIDKISELTAQKIDLEKQKQDFSELKQKITTLEAELAKMKEGLKKKLEEHSKLLQAPPVHAATGPILRALTERSITQYQEAGEQLAVALESTRKLNSTYLQADEGVLRKTQSLPLRNKQMAFFKRWVPYLRTNYIRIVPSFQSQSKKEIVRDRIEKIQDALNVLEQSLQLLDQHDAQATTLPRAAHFLSNERNNFREQILQQIQTKEKYLSEFILGAMGDFLRLDPVKYLTEALHYYFETRTIFDTRLQELGLIDLQKEKTERYLAPLDYAQERAVLDEQIHLLSFIAFTALLATDLQHPLLPILHGEIKTNFPKPPFIPLLQKTTQEFLKPLTGKIQEVLQTYIAFEQSIPSSDFKTMQKLWRECKKAIYSLQQDLPKESQLFSGSYDTSLTALLQTLPDNLRTERKNVTELKKELKKEEDLLKIGDLAASLSSLKQNTLKTTELFDHLKSRSLSFINSHLEEFPKLQLNQWVLKKYQHHLSIKNHLHWPSDKTDPYYMRNETHIPV